MPRLSLCAVMARSDAARALAAPLLAGARLAGPASGPGADLAAVYAPVEPGALAPLLGARAARRAAGRALVARQALLETLMAAGDVLPVPPGQPIAIEEAPDALIANAAVLRAGLRAFAGRAQHQIRIDWDPAAALVRFADAPELAAAMARRDDAAAFGPALQRGAEALRARLGRDFAARVEAACADVVGLPLEGPESLVNLACLSDATGAPRLEAALEAIDALWPEGLRIRMIGPSPAISFAAVTARRPDAAALEAAADRLDMDWPCAEPEAVDAAFRRAAKAAHPDAAPGETDGDAIAALREAATLLRAAAAARASLINAGVNAPAFPCPPLIVLRRDGDAAARAAAPAPRTEIAA
jgi:hypothetical protein